MQQPVQIIENALHPHGRRRRSPRRLWLPEDAETGRCRRSWNTSPIASATARAAATSRCMAGSPATAMPPSASTCAAPAKSDGLLADEYLKQEQDDALRGDRLDRRAALVHGTVGMMGKSWGGFNALQVAARRPPALKAVITVCSTDDRYADDIHYMGGCLLNDNLWWGAIMLAYQARPADPADRRRGLARALAAAAGAAAASSRRSGCGTSAATPTGSTARSARTSRHRSARSWPSAAGPTATPTPSRACSSSCRCRASA